MKHLLDTAVWYRAAVAPETLGSKLRRILENEETVGLSVISVWEISKKHQIGKLPIELPLEDWLKRAINQQTELLPLTPGIIVDAMSLPDFPNRDPADELIVATARINDLVLLTTDHELRSYSHVKLVYSKLVATKAP